VRYGFIAVASLRLPVRLRDEAAITREASLRVAENVCPSAFNLGVESAPVSFRH